MNSYPQISEYIEAIKMAKENFNELTYLRPVLDENGEPIMSSGNFAVVFKMKDERTGKLHAVKCFLREQEGRAEAYRLISEELEHVNSTYLTTIKYLDKELFVDSSSTDDNEFPVLLMDWVEGETLDKYICKHNNAGNELLVLSYKFTCMATWLLSQPFAHGDLKYDNIIVSEDGSLTLIDYDGMYVPTMKGQKARELGSPDFRHPSRDEDDFNEYIDDFALSIIALTLFSVSVSLSLKFDYIEKDCLLFRNSDYKDIGNSQTFHSIITLSSNPDVARCVTAFLWALTNKDFRLFNISPYESIFSEIRNTKVTEEDYNSAIVDKYVAKYSQDGKKLLSGPNHHILGPINIIYQVSKGTLTICDNAFGFGNNDAQKIIIPSSVLFIGESSFYVDSKIKNIICESNSFVVDNNCLYTCDKKRLLVCFEQNNYIVNIPKETIVIDEGAFSSCYEYPPYFIRIQNVPSARFILGDAKLLIENSKYVDKLLEIGFKSDDIVVGDIYIDEYGVVYSADKTKLIFYPRKLSHRVYHILEGCKEIAPNAFQFFPDGDRDGFYIYGNELVELSLPSSLNLIGAYGLQGCTQLEKIRFPHHSQQKITDLMNTYSDWQYSHSDFVDIMIPDKSITMNNCNDYFIDNDGVKYSNDGTKLLYVPHHLSGKYVIKEGVRIICDDTFNGSGISYVVMPESIEYIGDSAFSNSKIERIELSKGLIYIGDSAFTNCHLEEIVLPNTLKYIGNYAFSFCSILNKIVIPPSLIYIGTNPFVGCSLLSKIVFSNYNHYTKYEFKDNAFYNRKSRLLITCLSKEEVFLFPNGVWHIGDRAFASCESMKRIVFSDCPLSVGTDVFYGCKSLNSIEIPFGTRDKFELLFPNLKNILIEGNPPVLDPDDLPF